MAGRPQQMKCMKRPCLKVSGHKQETTNQGWLHRRRTISFPSTDLFWSVPNTNVVATVILWKGRSPIHGCLSRVLVWRNEKTYSFWFLGSWTTKGHLTYLQHQSRLTKFFSFIWNLIDAFVSRCAFGALLDLPQWPAETWRWEAILDIYHISVCMQLYAYSTVYT